MKKLKKWLSAAGIRAIKTFAQSFASMMTVGAGFGEIDWKYTLSCSFVALIYSFMTSLAGLPELKESDFGE